MLCLVDSNFVPPSQEICADDALSAYAALYEVERLRPSLICNKAWAKVRQYAYEQFAEAFEVAQ